MEQHSPAHGKQIDPQWELRTHDTMVAFRYWLGQSMWYISIFFKQLHPRLLFTQKKKPKKKERLLSFFVVCVCVCVCPAVSLALTMSAIERDKDKTHEVETSPDKRYVRVRHLPIVELVVAVVVVVAAAAAVRGCVIRTLFVVQICPFVCWVCGSPRMHTSVSIAV
jgi:hypothetical protein